MNNIQIPLSSSVPMAQSCATGVPLNLTAGYFMQQEIIFDEEVWKPVAFYEKNYAISSLGQVRSFKHGKTKNLVLKKKRNGYLFVALCKKGVIKYHHVHRLVAMEFVPNPGNKAQVNHIDLNKQNNRVDNLEWVTHTENQIHARKNKPYKSNTPIGIRHLKSSPVLQLSMDGKELFVWENLTVASMFYGAAAGTLSVVCRRTGVGLGFKWKCVTKKYFTENKHRFLQPPTPIINNLKTRDLTKAHQSKMANIKSVTPLFILSHGISCLKEYGNLRRDTYEKYARENKVGSYRYVINLFGSWNSFKEKVTHA